MMLLNKVILTKSTCTLSPTASQRCRQIDMSNLPSGASILFLCLNNILPASLRIRSTWKVYSDLYLVWSLFLHNQHQLIYWTSNVSSCSCTTQDPVISTEFPTAYYDSVKKIHETGGHGSIGYRAPFQKSETEKLLLRTHTTSVSANMLYEIARDCREKGDGEFRPSKLFSIDRVFRNEAVDATHLAEFHQVEGVVADKNITLGDLIGQPTSFSFPIDIYSQLIRPLQTFTCTYLGFMRVFFAKMGIHDIRVKPTYNPYTGAVPSFPFPLIWQVSLGLDFFFLWYNRRGTWFARTFHGNLFMARGLAKMGRDRKLWPLPAGNAWCVSSKMASRSNVDSFCTIILEPMGIPHDVRVLGWGLSLERPTMIKYVDLRADLPQNHQVLCHGISLHSTITKLTKCLWSGVLGMAYRTSESYLAIRFL